jgi:hypothetical protein
MGIFEEKTLKISYPSILPFLEFTLALPDECFVSIKFRFKELCTIVEQYIPGSPFPRIFLQGQNQPALNPNILIIEFVPTGSRIAKFTFVQFRVPVIPLGQQGESGGEWILLRLGNISSMSALSVGHQDESIFDP